MLFMFYEVIEIHKIKLHLFKLHLYFVIAQIDARLHISD